ncbi:carbohydrate ABC transporter permease [Nitratireductor pacificus]|uniref:CUT1 family carbohydrate ABC transporter membrane protein 1 n=1 Tax=Nitratireductor pacificus pht-3B TaxID=391937 RepID=K2MAF2_9HYPH|nr:sugar ABC transporter permease [Nitratireductor pacificus]EKF17980.1 CUT1 family carbohydrate ABC transporter membrane protein 1 [Nitratireductor pacificus pht-3B]
MSGVSEKKGKGGPPAGSGGGLANFLTEGGGFLLIMLLPALLVLGFVIGLPMLKALILSFDTINFRRPAAAGTFGWHNYEKLIFDAQVWNAVWRSALYMGGTVVGSIVLALSAALLTRRIVRFRALARLTFLIPWTVPAVVTALVWGVMYEGNFGVINRLLEPLPFIDRADWLIDRNTALPALILAQVWNEFPVAYIFFLAGLHSIPDELYEAARIDRASAFNQFRHITLPQLSTITAVIVILLMIMGFKSFPIIFILTGGGPAGATETMTVLTYNTAFRKLDFSYAATLGILAVLISLAMVLAYLRVMKRAERGAGGAV